MNSITLTQLINSLVNGSDFQEGTVITINKNELIHDKEISFYNNLYYKHIPTNSYLFVQYTDDENDVKIYIVLPNESPKEDNWKHHLADDYADSYIWDKLDEDNDNVEFTIEYRYKIY